MSELQRVRVWDLPTRLFHVVLALAVIGAVVSAKIGGAAMVWHFRLGYLVFGLLVFRLLWGFLGGRWSRFASFLYSPAVTLRYLRGRATPADRLEVGHSPLGALSVFAVLAVLAVQVATGLVGDDEIANVGPLNRYVSGATGLAATAWHKQWGQWIILALVALHVAGAAAPEPLAGDALSHSRDGATLALSLASDRRHDAALGVRGRSRRALDPLDVRHRDGQRQCLGDLRSQRCPAR